MYGQSQMGMAQRQTLEGIKFSVTNLVCNIAEPHEPHPYHHNPWNEQLDFELEILLRLFCWWSQCWGVHVAINSAKVWRVPAEQKVIVRFSTNQLPMKKENIRKQCSDSLRGLLGKIILSDTMILRFGTSQPTSPWLHPQETIGDKLLVILSSTNSCLICLEFHKWTPNAAFVKARPPRPLLLRTGTPRGSHFF